MEATKINVALEPIRTSLGATPTQLLLVVAGYVLTFGLTLVPAGRIGDMRSRKALMVIGIAVFTVASAACALAWNADALVGARLLAGVGAGVLTPQVVGQIQSLFVGRERGMAFGQLGAATAVSTAVGPSIAGLAVTLGGPEDGWRWMFWANVPIGIAILAAVAILVRKGTAVAPVQRLDMDIVGIVLLGTTLVSLLVPFILTTGAESDRPERWWLLLVAGAGSAAFVLWERNYEGCGRLPLVPLALFRSAHYRNGVLTSLTFFAASFPTLTLTSIYLQQGLRMTAFEAGLISFLPAIASATAASFAGRMVYRVGRPLVLMGLLLALISSVALAVSALTAPPGAAIWAIAIAWGLGGAGVGMVGSPNQALTLVATAPGSSGLAGSVMQLAQRVGTIVGVAACLPLYYYPPSGGPGQTPPEVGYVWGLAVTVLFYVVAITIGVGDWRRSRSGR